MHPAIIAALVLAASLAILCLVALLCAPSLEDMDAERL